MGNVDSVASAAASSYTAGTTQTAGVKSDSSAKGKDNAAKKEQPAATFEAGASSTGAAAQNKRIGAYASKEERDAVVAQLKQDQEARINQLQDIVTQLMTKQGAAYGAANDMWQFLASGKFEVDAATKAQAQEDISENGYWGVKQTSERIFDFAMALSGGTEEGMKQMEKAFEKGFKQATKTWGEELPDISKNTYDATKKLFSDYYAKLSSGNAEDGTQSEA